MSDISRPKSFSDPNDALKLCQSFKPGRFGRDEVVARFFGGAITIEVSVAGMLWFMKLDKKKFNPAFLSAYEEVFNGKYGRAGKTCMTLATDHSDIGYNGYHEPAMFVQTLAECIEKQKRDWHEAGLCTCCNAHTKD